MGFGDERGNIEPMYTTAASQLANKVYPDLATIPGGEAARPQREKDRIDAARHTAKVLRFLDERGLIDMTAVTETLIDPPACANSSLHQSKDIDGVFNSQRYSNIAGGCESAARAIRDLGLSHQMIQDCPKLLEDYKAKGAPQTATCVAELLFFADATTD